MGIGSCESTASSHRAHLQRSPGSSSYAHEPSSQEPKLGRTDRLAAPGRTRPGWSLGSRRRLEPPLVLRAGIAPCTAAGHGCSVRSCRVRGGQGGDGGDLGRIQVFPEDPLGPSGAAAADDLLTGTIRSRRKSWSVSGSLGKQLRVDGGGHHGLGAEQASLDQQRELQVEKPPPLPTRGPSWFTATLPQTTRSTGCSSPNADPPPDVRRAGDRGGAPRWDVEPRRVEEDEGTLVGQAGDGHVQQLAVGQSLCPDRELGASGLALTTRAARHAGSEASRAAAGAPAKLGIRPVAPGKRVARSRSRRAQMRSRTARLARPTSSS
jgi:hypothetical protein